MDLPAKVTGPWTLADLRAGKIGTPKHGLRVFSTFACGGGSTMGYKLAGYDVVGACEIDPRMAALYRRNHDPKHLFVEPIQELVKRPDLPEDLYGLDVLDGSPPCSVFSMAGKREKDWGRERVFAEGQAEQRLDDLFFHYIKLVERLRPRVAVAENVKGLIQGNAKGYVKEIFAAFRAAGYEVQLFLLNASRMGVPQTRERTFFLARRVDLGLPLASLKLEESPISISMACATADKSGALGLVKMSLDLWKKTAPGKGFNTSHPHGSWFTHKRPHPMHPMHTMISGSSPSYHWKEPRYLSVGELKRIQTFPEDYEFLDQDPRFIMGMSVPPFMMQRVALEVARQWLLK